MISLRMLPPILLAAGLAAMLAACSEVSSQRTLAARPQPYRVGGAAFDLTGANVLQTWPIIQYEAPLRFARIAVQMPPDALLADLPKDAGRIQIDILAPQENAAPDRVLAANFTDWPGREIRVAGTRYHYDPGSPLLEDGGRAVYVRHATPGMGLEALEPPQPRGRAPAFYLHRSGGTVDAAIDCREDVPPSTGTGEYCSLRRQIGTDYGYRILFSRTLLPDWARLDAAARDYLARAAALGGS
jgi:hypothetical protein